MIKIAIDAGHGAPDPGAHGKYSIEAAVNFTVASLISTGLKGLGYNTMMTRNTPNRLIATSSKEDLRERCRRTADCNILVSIHCNSSAKPGPRGWEIWTTPGNNGSDNLAKCIYKETSELLPKSWPFRTHDKSKEANFYMLKHGASVSVLIELDFINTPSGEIVLNNESVQRLYADGIINGIKTYIKSLR